MKLDIQETGITFVQRELPAYGYFTKKTLTYQNDSKRWPWSWLRAREANAVFDLLGNLIEDKDVLELGCGAGFYTHLLLENGARHIDAVDVVPDMVRQLNDSRVTVHVADATEVSFERPFQVILSAGLLEFVSDSTALLTNARKLLAEGGIFVVLAPTANLWGRLYRAFHQRHGVPVTLFSLAQIKEIAADAGWRFEASRTVWPFTVVVKFLPVF